MRTAPSITVWIVAIALLTGCPSSPTPPDAFDAMAQPDVRDGTLADAGDTASDVVSDAACLGPALEDLAALATATPSGLDYVSDNAASSDGSATLDAPDALLQPTRCIRQFRAVHERLFRYRMRSTAALRVSTDNPRSSATFDSVLFIAQLPCAGDLAVLACNDDDPFAPPGPHVTLSLATTPVLSAGTDVVIAVAGFYPGVGSGEALNPNGVVGMFELTVAEVTPIAVGATCDPSGAQNVCPQATTCIADTLEQVHSTCVPDGMSAGAACLADGACSPGLVCDTSNNRCYAVVPEGAACERLGVARQRCADGFTCVSPTRGSVRGVCRINGGAMFAACAAGDTCSGPGLVCRPNPGQAGTCVRLVAVGGACGTNDSLCTAGESCVAVASGGVAGRCVPNGTIIGSTCRAGAPECDGALACITGFLDRTCRSVSPAHGPCGPLGACAGGAVCVAFDPSQPSAGTCVMAGEQGAPCRTMGPACDPGLACSATMPAQGHCVAAAAAGAQCDTPARAFACAAGTSCVRSGSSGTAGTCVAGGTMAGAACRASTPRCDGALACSAMRGAGVCQSVAAAGAACDPRFASVQCPAMQVCMATRFDTGACAATTMASEPNDVVPPSAAIAAPAVIASTLNAFDLDCYGIDVVDGGGVFALITGANGTCPGSLALELYRNDGGLLGSDATSGAFGCPRIDGSDGNGFAWARTLAAGRYTVCTREATDRRAFGPYLLSVGSLAP